MNGERDPMGTWAPWHKRHDIGPIILGLAMLLAFILVTQGMGGYWE